MIMSALQARTAGGGMPPGGGPAAAAGGATPGADPSGGQDPAAQFAQQVAELKGADPGMLQRQVGKMKQMCAVLMVQNLERLPNVVGQLSKLIPMFDRVLKEIGQASNVNSAVRNPIGMGQAQPDSMGAPPNGGM
jgi:hypothetical protein